VRGFLRAASLPSSGTHFAGSLLWKIVFSSSRHVTAGSAVFGPSRLCRSIFPTASDFSARACRGGVWLNVDGHQVTQRSISHVGYMRFAFRGGDGIGPMPSSRQPHHGEAHPRTPHPPLGQRPRMAVGHRGQLEISAIVFIASQVHSSFLEPTMVIRLARFMKAKPSSEWRAPRERHLSKIFLERTGSGVVTHPQLILHVARDTLAKPAAKIPRSIR